MEIRADRRRIEVRGDGEAMSAFRAAHRANRASQIDMAQALVRLERSKSHAVLGYASAVDFAVADGMDRGRAVELRNLGRALEVVPEVEGRIADAEITPQDVAAVGRVMKRAELAKESPEPAVLAAEGRRLIELSRMATTREFRFETRRAEEEIAQRGRDAFRPFPNGDDGLDPPDPLVSQSFVVPESSRDRFFRAKDLAERKAERTMTPGEAFTFITDDFLLRHDALLKKPRRRRVGPTRDRPRDRYVPAQAKRAVRERAGDRCEFAGCGSRVFLQLAHIVPQRARGDREFGNLCLLCTAHHTMYDGGAIVLLQMLAEGPEFAIVETGEVFAPARRREPPPRPPGSPERPAVGRSRSSAPTTHFRGRHDGLREPNGSSMGALRPGRAARRYRSGGDGVGFVSQTRLSYGVPWRWSTDAMSRRCSQRARDPPRSEELD